ncbi:MAG: aminoacyl-tRNA hydrolase [bacterium]
MTKTIIIIGLGNPGKDYKKTRHNAGFLAIDAFANNNSFPDFIFQKKFNALVSEKIDDNSKIILIKPQTFMNNSGSAAAKITTFYKIKDLLIVHDDIDLALGKIKIVKNRGSAGHKGVESIIKTLGAKNLVRIRIGILTAAGQKKKIRAEKLVLKDFNKKEETILNETIKKTAEAISLFLNKGITAAMNKFN